MGEVKAHAVLSPSSASRWMACTPSARFEEQFENKSSVFADEGTLAHAISEDILRLRLGQIAKDDFEELLVTHKQSLLYSEEMLVHCEQYADFCMYDAEEGDVCAVETRLDITKYIPDGFGTGDFMRVKPKKGILKFKDLKYGKGVAVSAINNTQLKIYALGALDWWGWMYDIDTVEVSIFQPRINNNSTWSISVEELTAWAESELTPKAQMAFKGEGVYAPGNHCKFCRARVKCKALAEHNLDLFKHELRAHEELTDAELVEVVKRGSLLAAWYKDIEEYMLSEAVKGKKWEGMKVVEGKSSRVFVSADRTEKKLLEAGHTDIYTPKELLGVTKLKSKLGAKVFKELVEPDLRKPPGKPTLVPESDPRPDFDNALAVFKDIEIKEEIQD